MYDCTVQTETCVFRDKSLNVSDLKLQELDMIIFVKLLTNVQ